ncbi:putative ribonuclease H-like domain-containing protein [Tanacetum coccineum]
MRPFGCPVTILNTIDHLGKFDGKADEGFFVGYSTNSKAFRVFNSRTRIVEENLHVKFSEETPNIAGSGPNWLFDIDALSKSMNYKPVVAGNQSNCDAGMETVPSTYYILLPLWTQDPPFSSSSKDSPDDGFKPSGRRKSMMLKIQGMNIVRFQDNVVDENIVYRCADDPNMPELEDIVHSDDDEYVGAEADMTNLDIHIPVSPILTTRIHKDHLIEQIIRDIHSAPQTRRMTMSVTEQAMFSSVQQRINYKDFQNYLFACFLSQEEPKKVIQALKDPSWIEAMQEELLQFKLQQVWTLVELPNGKRAIGTKWIYRNKKDERGIVVRNKARLVAQGYTQEEGIDYDEVFDPIASIEAIRLFLAYASFKDFVVYQMDVKSTFMYGKIEKEVYVCQASGFEDPEFLDKVYKVEKALYGLHQAPRAWYETLSTYLLDNGFQRGKIDKTLFIKRVKSDILLVQVYVDDIIFGSTRKEMCTEFEKIMHKKFQMSSMGELTFFLGLQVTQKDDGIFISQDKYVDEILKKFGFSTVKTASTPMETSKPLMKDENAEDVDVHLYRSMIGSLMYLSSSRPDIMFVDAPFDLEAYTNSDYTGASLERKSITGVDYLPNDDLNEKPEESDGLKGIIDFLNASSIHYALTVNPTIYTLCIQQFWATAKAKTVNGERQIQALVDKKKVVITEATIRRDLRLEDAEGIEYLPNAIIFEQLTLMGFVQVFLEKQLGDMSQHKGIYATPSYTKKVFANMKREGKGFSGRVTPLFQSMMVQAPEEVGEGSAVPTDPHHTSTTTQPSTSRPQKQQKPRRKQRKDTEVPETSGPTKHVADETEEHVPIQSNDPPLFRVNTLGSGEDSLKLNELMELCTNLQQRVLDLENTKTTQALEIDSLKRRVKKLEKKIESSEDEDNDLQGEEVVIDKEVAEKEVSTADPVTTAGEVVTNVSTAATITPEEVTLAQALVQIKTSKPKVKGIVFKEPSESTITTPTPIVTSQQSSQAKDKGKAKMIEPEKPLKKNDQVMFDEKVAQELQAKLDVELEEEEKLAKQREEDANLLSWDNTQVMMEADYELAQRLQAEEQEELTIEENSKMFVELMDKRKKHFARLRAEEIRSKPPTKAQKRTQMSTYLKNMAGYKQSQLKNKSFEEIQMLFDKTMKWVDLFVPMDSEVVKDSEKGAEESSSKREGIELEQEVSKKQKIDDDQDEAEMKKHMEIVFDEEELVFDVVPLAIKPPMIVDWKIIKEGKMGYFQLIRADGTKHGNTRPEEGYERVLWGDLKVMFEPDVESEDQHTALAREIRASRSSDAIRARSYISNSLVGLLYGDHESVNSTMGQSRPGLSRSNSCGALPNIKGGGDGILGRGDDKGDSGDGNGNGGVGAASHASMCASMDGGKGV